MLHTTFLERRRLESLSRGDLAEHQRRRLNVLVKAILPRNRFYAEKLAPQFDFDRLSDANGPLGSLDELAEWPYTFKEELQPVAGSEPWASNLTFPQDDYLRYHQTSGTRGRPMAVLDTGEDWQWWLECWQYVFDAADIQPNDRLLMAFSFGPFVGFWSAFEAAIARGCLVVPAGGLTTLARLEMLRSARATVVFSTPSYALHMAEVGAAHQIDVAHLGLRKVVLAGEPGGSIPHVRARIGELWDAEVFDHGGATEIGPWGYGDATARGMHVMESEFIAEFLSLETGQAAVEGELSELVLTNLGRVGCPVIRYRTGDLVRPIWEHESANRFVLLDGGIVGRSDDMLVVRGVNIFPSSIDQILRSFPEVVEYRTTIDKAGAMDQITVEVEDRLEEPARIAEELRLRLGLKIEVYPVPLGSLPRFEGKGKRVIDQR
ncbi:MAG TPA: AMP-binding protein [Pirellulales bacterium]|nr:AMP-binding protein [Pirellulales bacterium]